MTTNREHENAKIQIDQEKKKNLDVLDRVVNFQERLKAATEAHSLTLEQKDIEIAQLKEQLEK